MHAIANLPKKKKELYAAIELRYLCLHERREVRFRRIRDDRPTYYSQCVHCGNAGQAVSVLDGKRKTTGKPIPDFDYELEDKRRKAKSAEYSAVMLKLRKEFELLYPDYLQSAEWQEKRIPVMERANGKCEVCELNEATDVHHNTYDRLGEELPEDLSAVCSFCHNVLHGRIKL
jgi:hypothetical protein